MDKIAPF